MRGKVETNTNTTIMTTKAQILTGNNSNITKMFLNTWAASYNMLLFFKTHCNHLNIASYNK